MKIHSAACPFKQKSLQLSCDGVSETKSTSNSIDVYSVCFAKCKNIYPHKLVRPIGKYKVDARKCLGEVIDDIRDNNYTISQFIGDKPKRSQAKDCKCSSAWYACEYYFAKGTKIEISQNSQAKKKLLNQLQLIEEKIAECQLEENTPEKNIRIQNLVSLTEELQKSINALKRKSHIL